MRVIVRNGRLVIIIICFVVGGVIPSLQGSQDVLYGPDDVEVYDGTPRSAFLVKRVWLVHKLELFLEGGFSALSLPEKEKLERPCHRHRKYMRRLSWSIRE